MLICNDLLPSCKLWRQNVIEMVESHISKWYFAIDCTTTENCSLCVATPISFAFFCARFFSFFVAMFASFFLSRSTFIRIAREKYDIYSCSEAMCFVLWKCYKIYGAFHFLILQLVPIWFHFYFHSEAFKSTWYPNNINSPSMVFVCLALDPSSSVVVFRSSSLTHSWNNHAFSINSEPSHSF